MNLVIKHIESSYRDIEVDEVDCVYDVEHLSLIVQLLQMLDSYKIHNNTAMPGTITDLVEWNSKPLKEELPFN